MSSHRRKRPRGRALLVLSAATLTAATALPATGSLAEPKPTLDQVRKQVDRLQEEAEQAAERSNAFGDQAAALSRRLDKLSVDVHRQEQAVGKLRDSIGAYAASEYRSGGMDTTVQLLMSEDPDDFLAQMNSARAFEGQQGNALRHLQIEQKQLAEQKAEQKAELARLKDAKAEAAARLKEADAKVAKAKALLSKLTAAERRRLAEQQRERERQRASRGGRDDGGKLPPPPTGSGRGAIALRFARAQLGEPYVFAAAGPNSWDCSGLTMMAWRQAGVSLPHSAHEQYAVSAKVSQANIQPGDLIIYYSDMHHVGIYAGNGMVIHAPRPGKNVEYAPMHEMPISGIVRPG